MMMRNWRFRSSLLFSVLAMLAGLSAQTAPTPKASSSRPPQTAQNGDALPGQVFTRTKQKRPATVLPDPGRAEHDLHVAHFYFHRGMGDDYAAALGRYKDALRYSPKNLTAIAGIAASSAKLGEWSQAREYWRMFLKLQPSGKQARKIRKLLAKNAGRANAPRRPCFHGLLQYPNHCFQP